MKAKASTKGRLVFTTGEAAKAKADMRHSDRDRTEWDPPELAVWRKNLRIPQASQSSGRKVVAHLCNDQGNGGQHRVACVTHNSKSRSSEDPTLASHIECRVRKLLLSMPFLAQDVAIFRRVTPFIRVSVLVQRFGAPGLQALGNSPFFRYWVA